MICSGKDSMRSPSTAPWNRAFSLAFAWSLLLGCEAQQDSVPPPPKPSTSAPEEVARLFPASPPASGEVVHVNDRTFSAEVSQARGLVLVDFWAPWCGPCRQVGPIIEALARENAGKVKVVKFNVDEGSVVPGQFGVRSIPTVYLFRDGKALGSRVGALPKQAYEEMIRVAAR